MVNKFNKKWEINSRIKKNVNKYMKLFYPVKLTTDINLQFCIPLYLLFQRKIILYELYFYYYELHSKKKKK